MTTTINAVSGTGLVNTPDASGVVKLQSNGVTTNAIAWVNFNGNSGAIRASYNVGSVTRNTTGDYTINFSNALTDANYVATFSGSNVSAGSAWGLGNATPTTSALRVIAFSYNGASLADPTYAYIAVFGN